MNNLSGEPILVYDVETATERKKARAESDKLKIFGCYSYLTDKYYYLTQPSKIRQMINQHNILVGFNNKEYDNQVMYRNNYDDLIQAKPKQKGNGNIYTFKNKVNIDLREAIKKRAAAMVLKIDGKKTGLKDALMDYSLDTITQTIGVADATTGKIKDFDYSILNKETWTTEEQKYIVDYLQRDLEITKKFYEWTENYFESFKQFVSQKDIDTKQYLTCSLASFAYKVMCKSLGMKEEYSNEVRNEKFKGAVVFNPMAKEVHGTIVYFDFKSLYPTMYIGANLFGGNCSCCSPKEKWHGNDMLKVNGHYCTKKLDKRTEVLKEWFVFRDELKKKKDNMENVYKILLNSSYGASSSPIFKHIYDVTAASDCTYLGRQCIQYARKKFREAGAKIVFGDTDSCAILLPEGKDVNYAIDVSKQIVKDLRDSFPFPFELFDFKVECVATDFFFFDKDKKDNKEEEYIDDEDKEYAKNKLGKKNYIFITDDNYLTTKGLVVIKKGCSSLSRLIYKEVIKPKILSERKAKFPKEYIESLIFEYLKKDIGLAAKRFSTNDFEDYKEEGNLNAQIAKANGGAGYYWMVPVVKDVYSSTGEKLTLGKSKKYIMKDKFLSMNLPIRNINIDNFRQELRYFIIERDTKGTPEFAAEKLSRWFS